MWCHDHIGYGHDVYWEFSLSKFCQTYTVISSEYGNVIGNIICGSNLSVGHYGAMNNLSIDEYFMY